MKSITVFTPTYNRAHLLLRLYRSLCAQTSQDFCWLVVDDGSSDGTEALVRAWMKEGVIQIRYAFKPNGGMHTAHNLAYDLIDTELNVCIDSDDLMPTCAVERILARWRTASCDSTLAGLLGLDEALGGGLVGTAFPQDGMIATLPQVYDTYKVRGDKKVVLRTDIVRALPRYPEFAGERLVPLGSLYTQVGWFRPFLCINEVWAIVEYQPDGSSATVVKQYFRSPRGFRHEAVLNLSPGTTRKFRAKNLLKIEIMDLIIGRRGEDVRESLPRLCLSILLRSVSYPAYLFLRWRAGR
jgi:glycosyltransferase involved in cell wall biosynthesis